MARKSFTNQMSNEEIDIRPIIEKILRQKFFILSFVFASTFISAIVSINTPKTWQGEFQIVYDEESQKSTGGGLLSGLDFSVFNIGIGNKLNTQVSVLQSPYVLMDIYDYVRKKRNDKFLTFKKWTRSLDIEIVEGTSVVKVVYKDNDKVLLKKVLEDISDTYEKYRIEERKKDIAKSMVYLETQIKKYEQKANEDYSILQEYANEQLMYVPTVLSEKNVVAIDQFTADKIQAFNRLKEIEFNIDKINKIPIESDEIFSKSALLDNKKERIPEFNTYLQNEVKLSNLRKTFKEEDISIQSLIFHKSNLRKKIRSKLLSNLLAEKSYMEAKIDSLNRSQEKLNKYGNLLRRALKSNTTLQALEQNYVKLSLEKTNNLNEAQIITKPTILPYAIAPQKRRSVSITFIISLFIGSLIAYAYSKFKDVLLSEEEVIPIVQDKPIDYLYINKPEEWKDILGFQKQLMKFDSNTKIAIYNFGSRNDFNFSNLNNVFEEIFGKNNYKLTSSIEDLLECKNIICLIYLGSIKKSKFEKQIFRLNSLKDLNIGYLTIK